MVHRWLCFWDIRFYLYSNVLSVKEILYINKIQFFYCPFKSVITYITLTATDILHNITKQYYGIATVNKTIILRYYGKETV